MTACGGDDVDTATATEDEAAQTDAETENAPEETEEEPAAETEAATEEAAEEPAGGEVAVDFGATEEPCPEAVNPDNGCTYLAQLSDLTVGPFASQGPQIVEAAHASWQRVNEDGGIGGYDINTTEYVRDHQYNPEIVSQLYQEISDDVLAITNLLGSPMGIAVQPFLQDQGVLAVPGTWTSEWLFAPKILESGSTYCRRDELGGPRDRERHRARAGHGHPLPR